MTTTYRSSLIDQNFGLCITPDDLIFPFNFNGNNYCRPWRWFKQTGTRDSGSTINEDNNVIKITLDVQHFKPEEITVKVNDNKIIVEANHEEKLDEHGFISRQFKRRYTLPYDCPSDTVECALSSDGILIITAKKITKTVKAKEIIVPIKISGSSKTTDQTQNITTNTESNTKTLQSSTQDLPIVFDKDDQIILKDYCRLLKPEFLGAAVLESKKTAELLEASTHEVSARCKESETESKTTETLKLVTEQAQVSAKSTSSESDFNKIGELKYRTEQVNEELKKCESEFKNTAYDNAKSKISESASLEISSKATSTQVAEMQLMEKSKEALSDNKYASLGSISTINDQCQMTSDMNDINRISELSSALEEASAAPLCTKDNIAQLAEKMNISAKISTSQESMEILETTTSLKSTESGMTSREKLQESKLSEGMKISESLGASSARLGISSTIEDMMDKCSAEIAEITNKYSPGFMSTSGSSKMQSMSYSSSEMQESSYSSSSSTLKTSGESASILMSDVMAELREAAENIDK